LGDSGIILGRRFDSALLRENPRFAGHFVENQETIPIPLLPDFLKRAEFERLIFPGVDLNDRQPGLLGGIDRTSQELGPLGDQADRVDPQGLVLGRGDVDQVERALAAF
jgi:hypothetical protein